MLEVLLGDRYQIIKELGSGGFGTTYLAKDTQAGNSWCAIKKLNPEHADLSTAKKLFKREADTLFRLQEIHQVPKFIQYFAENDCNYIVEEYIEGDTLDSLLEQQWQIENIIIFLWEILSILQLLHNKNIIHRDIKPSNLIQRKKDNKFTIIDFGAVKEINPNQTEKASTCIYHHGYAPIEQIQGIPRLNSDIYALGMTAIQLLTKEPPREFTRDAEDKIVELESIIAPVGLINILNKMVRTDLKDRYQSVEEVLKDLGQRNNFNTIQNHQLANEQKCIPTKLEKNHETGLKSLFKNNSYLKFLYLPLIIFSLLLISSELIKPWFRPWYYLNQGDKLLDKNQAQASLNQFQNVIDLKRDSSPAWKGRGDALFNLRRYPGALGAYNKAISINPQNVKALNNKGKILSQQGQLPQAIDVYKQAVEIDSDNAEVWSGMGLAQMSMQQNEEALKSFDQAQNIKPDEPNIWIQKGIILRTLQRSSEANMFYQEALDVYDEATVKDNKNPLLWSDRGFVLLQLNRPQDAFASYDQALRVDENFYEALLGKANVHIQMQEHQEALEVLDQAKEIRPKDYQVWYNRGNILLQALNSPEEASRSFKQATELKEDFYPAWLGQGLSLSALQKYDEAKQVFNHAKELNPQDPFLWLNLGIVLENLGELDDALKAYETAAIELKFQPANEPLKQLQQTMGL